MAGFRIDQALVERLQDVDAYVLKPEPAYMPPDPHDEIAASLARCDPVEEVRFSLPGDAESRESFAVKKGERIRWRGGDHRRPSDGLGDDCKIGVLQKQIVAIDVGAVCEAEQPAPEFAFQLRGRRAGGGCPQLGEIVQRTLRPEAFAAEFACDRFWIWR